MSNSLFSWKQCGFLVLALCVTGEAFAAKNQLIDYVRIIVNSQMLTDSEVREQMDGLKTQILNSLPPGEERDLQLKELEKRTMDGLIEKLLLLDRTKELKLVVTEKEIEEQLDHLTETRPQLVATYTEDEIKEQIEEDIKQQRVIGHEVESKIHVREEDIIKACRDQATNKRELGIAQILIRKTAEEATKILAEVHQRMEGGVAFEKLAQDYSEDPSAHETGGKLGLYQKGQLLKEIDQAAFTMKVGEVSSLIKSQYGYHILYIYDEKAQTATRCDALSAADRDDLSNQLFSEYRSKALKKYLDNLRASARIIIKDSKGLALDFSKIE